MQERNATRQTIGIVGGGFTGGAVALHLARAIGKRHGVEIVVFEPRALLGAGLAYDTTESVHRINVPAGRMSLFAKEPDHFINWVTERDALRDDSDAFDRGGVPYPRRQLFGQYVAAHIEPWIGKGAIRHVRSRVVDVVRDARGWTVVDDAGVRTDVDLLVLAATHPSPGLPRPLLALKGAAGLISDPTLPDALSRVESDDRVLIVGNGLTAADVIAALARRGHRGNILSISRRGLRSKGHAPQAHDPFGVFSDPQPRHASELLHRVRLAVTEAEAQGKTWHCVLDAVRAQAQDLWKGLSTAERRRIVRHIRPFWDVHRFRIAPQVENAVETAIAEGRLQVLAASVVGARQDGEDLVVTLKRRRSTGIETFRFDKVIVTTGPDHGSVVDSQPFLKSLADQHAIEACPTGLGIHCDLQGRAITDSGQISQDIFVAGPLARGTFGELMGLPQVSEYAEFIAERVAERLGAALIKVSAAV